MFDEADSAPYYQWQPPEKGVAVGLSLAVVERLGTLVRQDEDPATHRPFEIGGFLWGAVKRVNGVMVVRVDGFEPVECEHASGPSYFLSGSDQKRLAAQLRSFRPPRGASIVGFFRSNTRKEFSLSVEDVDLMARYFAKPSMVLLLVHAAPDGSLRGGFSIWEQKAIRTLKPYLEFPFDVRALLAGGYEIAGRQPARRIAPARMPVGRQLPAPSNAIALHGTGTDLMRPAGGLTAAWRSPVVHVRVEAGTMLAIRRAAARFSRVLPGRMRMEWLVAAAALTIALAAGVMQREARVPASPLPPIAQSKRSPERAPEAAGHESPFAAAALPAPLPADPPASASAEPLAPPAPKPALTAEVSVGPAVPPPQAVKPKLATTPRIAVIPVAPPVAASLPALSLPAPPAIAWAPPKSPAPVLPESGSVPAVAGTASNSFVSIAVNPLLPGHRKLLGRLFSGKKEPAAFEPPRLLEQSTPEVPQDVRDRIRGTVPVSVKLYVDRAGAVEYAELLSDGTGANRDVAALAVFASRKWQFAPARQGGEAIPAEVVVQFRFGTGTDRPDRIVAGQRGGASRSTQ